MFFEIDSEYLIDGLCTSITLFISNRITPKGNNPIVFLGGITRLINR